MSLNLHTKAFLLCHKFGKIGRVVVKLYGAFSLAFCYLLFTSLMSSLVWPSPNQLQKHPSTVMWYISITNKVLFNASEVARRKFPFLSISRAKDQSEMTLDPISMGFLSFKRVFQFYLHWWKVFTQEYFYMKLYPISGLRS